jgi:hypothetical protein
MLVRSWEGIASVDVRNAGQGAIRPAGAQIDVITGEFTISRLVWRGKVFYPVNQPCGIPDRISASFFN